MEATDVSQAEMNRLVTRYREYMMSLDYDNNEPNFIIHRLVSSEYACWVSLFSFFLQLLLLFLFLNFFLGFFVITSFEKDFLFLIL
jgi:hypothetical protein